MFTIANTLMGLLFATAVAVQYNDPDPLTWMLIYGAAATACFYAFRDGAAWQVPAMVSAAAFVGVLLLAPGALEAGSWGDVAESMQASNPSIELRRELLGLLIIAVWTLVLTLWLRRRNTKAS